MNYIIYRGTEKDPHVRVEISLADGVETARVYSVGVTNHNGADVLVDGRPFSVPDGLQHAMKIAHEQGVPVFVRLDGVKWRDAWGVLEMPKR